MIKLVFLKDVFKIILLHKYKSRNLISDIWQFVDHFHRCHGPQSKKQKEQLDLFGSLAFPLPFLGPTLQGINKKIK